MNTNPLTGAMLTQNAILVTQGINPCGCTITCISVKDNQATLSVGQITSPLATQQFANGLVHSTELHIFRLAGRTPNPIHLKGKVTQDNNQGVVFTCQPLSEVLSELQAITIPPDPQPETENILPIDSLIQVYNRQGSVLLSNLLSVFLEEVTTGIDHTLAAASELREINRLKDMRFIFYSRQKQIFQDFEARFTATNKKLASGQASHGRQDELHLLQRKVFEDWLELQTISSQLANRYPDLHFALTQLLSQIFRQDITNSNNPLSPVSLCLYLQQTIDRLGIAREHRHTIYEAFGAALNHVWPAAIQSFITRCTGAGLHTLSYSELPVNWSLRESVKPDEKPATLAPDNTTPSVAREDVATGNRPSSVHKPDQTIFRLMGLQQGTHGSSNGWQKSSQQFCENLKPNRSDLLQKIRGGQPEISRAIHELAGTNPELGKSLDQPTIEKANLVDQIFAPLQNQDNISDGLRERLEQLRLPVFEVLLETPEFLNEQNHPAREIVNGLMKLCYADRISTKSLDATVSAIIEELVQTEPQNSRQLHSLNKQLKQLVERQDQSFLRNAERLAKTLEGKERLRKTRQQVQRQLNGILAGKDIPKVLIELLESGWEQLMVLALLREGPDSPHHEELMNVVVLLQAWLSPQGENDELAFERELESNAVLGLIDRELRLVGDITRFRSVMTKLTEQLHGQSGAGMVHIERYGSEPDTAPPSDGSEPNRWVRRAREIEVGDWVELRLETGEVRRMRLIWSDSNGLRFVFLAPDGMGEMNLDFGGFVQKLESGQAWLVSEEAVPFVDQSLFSMVQDVYRRLNFQATHDPLTGCMRRFDFEKHVTGIQEQAGLSGTGSALIVLDIDEFSVINATYGAEGGDELLSATGQLLQKRGISRTPEARIGRISSNEFAILDQGRSIEESLDFADRLRRDFEQHMFSHGDAEYSVTLSVCVCPINDRTASAGDLLNRASLALKAVKRRGGNQTELLGIHQVQQETATPQWVSEIDRSIRDGSLYLRAQSIVALNRSHKGGKSYELLLGLRNASGDEVSPQSYIQAAEQFRRSTRVDIWVVNQTLDWMNKNPDIITNIDTLNVNLSGRSISDDAFMLQLESILRQHRGLTPKICFEITETAAVSNLHYAAGFIKEMKRLECRFALDDFGTGMSSYAYLQKLPVDYVKIDGTFVRDIATNLTNYAMVRSINELCHFLDLETIAECVEDLEVIDTLREMQVDFVQGYGIAKPRRLDSITSDTVSHQGFSL